MILAIVCFLFFMIVIGYMLLILFYRKGWMLLHEFKIRKNYTPKTKVSVIIPARNEENNIRSVLQDVLAQVYPSHLLQIIVVDDHSTDKTAEIIKSFDNVLYISLEEVLHNIPQKAYKKKAIEYAIQQSTGDVIITTDADCNMCEYWLQSIVQSYETYGYKCIAAPVCFHEQKHWFAYFQSIDFITMQGITGAVLYTKSASMCNGANFAYEKNAYYAVDGFKDIDAIASGDDMLLMQKIEKKFPNQSSYLKCKDAIVYTHTMPTVHDFLQQRIRWASKAPYFKDATIKNVLLLVFVLNCLFPVLLLLSFYKLTFLSVAFIYLAIKVIVEYFFIVQVSTFFNKQKELLWLIVLQPIHILYMIVAGVLGMFGTYQWKGRKTK